jgi:hypothetical protein
MRPLRVLAAGLAVLAGSAWPIAGPAATGCATGAPHAGLVVDNGSRTIELCVALDATSVSGLHLIELAHEQLGLSYAFGQGGEAVCRLDGVGPEGDDCFADYPDFWGYWHGDGHGGWTWSSVGGDSYEVGDGGLDAWVWGAGDTGATHPAPPSLSAGDVCAVASPSPSPTKTTAGAAAASRDPSQAKSSNVAGAGRREGRSVPLAAVSSPAASDGDRRAQADHHSTAPPSRKDKGTAAAAASAAGVVRAAAPSGGPKTGGGGPPPGLFVALGLAFALGLGGWLRLRSHPEGRTSPREGPG